MKKCKHNHIYRDIKTGFDTCRNCDSIFVPQHKFNRRDVTNQPTTISEQLAGNSEQQGTKHDDGKPDMSLLSPIAITAIAEVMSFGKRKYAAHNWRAGFNWSRLIAAALRHIFAYLGGENKDPESGLSHLAHASCCLMFLLEFEVTHADKDDRHKPESK